MTVADHQPWCALGLSQAHLNEVPGVGLAMTDAAEALMRLRRRARAAGFDLAIASGYRDYFRQLAIFNAKACGIRGVTNDFGDPLSPTDMDAEAWLHAILRFSALPGLSRHHWGTDFDVWDRASVPASYTLRLEPSEYASGGPFAEFSAWLGELISRDDAEGFFRPYEVDRGGVAPESWHLSYRPLASGMSEGVSAERLLAVWHCRADDAPCTLNEPLAMLEIIEPRLGALLSRYYL